jgi:hypothetical protein
VAQMTGVMRARISPELRELFEQRGVDAIRAIATTVTSRESPLLFTGGIKATVGDLEDWLWEMDAIRAARRTLIVSGIAAGAGIAAAVLTLLAWMSPLK